MWSNMASSLAGIIRSHANITRKAFIVRSYPHAGESCTMTSPYKNRGDLHVILMRLSEQVVRESHNNLSVQEIYGPLSRCLGFEQDRLCEFGIVNPPGLDDQIDVPFCRLKEKARLGRLWVVRGTAQAGLPFLQKARGLAQALIQIIPPLRERLEIRRIVAAQALRRHRLHGMLLLNVVASYTVSQLYVAAGGRLNRLNLHSTGKEGVLELVTGNAPLVVVAHAVMAPRQRGARIETAQRAWRIDPSRASLPGNGERGLKHGWLLDWRAANCIASLPGNGERGLKLR